MQQNKPSIFIALASLTLVLGVALTFIGVVLVNIPEGLPILYGVPRMGVATFGLIVIFLLPDLARQQRKEKKKVKQDA